MVVKSFRGLLADGGQDRIWLQTIQGKVGYRIVKFQIIPENIGPTDYEHTVKIYKTEQSSITANINFTETDLLAAGYTEGHSSLAYIGNPVTVIFDNVIFNQDVYVTHEDTQGALSCNYYIELEVIPLSDQDAQLTTLKDIRTNA